MPASNRDARSASAEELKGCKYIAEVGLLRNFNLDHLVLKVIHCRQLSAMRTLRVKGLSHPLLFFRIQHHCANVLCSVPSVVSYNL